MRKVFALALVLAVAIIGAPASAITTASKAPAASVQMQTGTVTGVMKDAAGNPLQNATVNIVDKAGNVIATATTDANGLFSVAVNPGTYSVSVTAAGSTAAVASTATVAVAAGSTVTIAASVTAAGALAVTTGAAGFIAALGGPIVAGALIAGGVVGAVAIQQALDETTTSPSR